MFRHHVPSIATPGRQPENLRPGHFCRVVLGDCALRLWLLCSSLLPPLADLTNKHSVLKPATFTSFKDHRENTAMSVQTAGCSSPASPGNLHLPTDTESSGGQGEGHRLVLVTKTKVLFGGAVGECNCLPSRGYLPDMLTKGTFKECIHKATQRLAATNDLQAGAAFV